MVDARYVEPRIQVCRSVSHTRIPPSRVRLLALQLLFVFLFSDLPRSLGLCTWGADGATVMSQGTGACLHCPVGTETDRISVTE